MGDFRALDPFFRIIEQGLTGLVTVTTSVGVRLTPHGISGAVIATGHSRLSIRRSVPVITDELSVRSVREWAQCLYDPATFICD
jgi:hypothetical protein